MKYATAFIPALVSVAAFGIGAVFAAPLAIGWDDLRPADQPVWILGLTDGLANAPKGRRLTTKLSAQTVDISGFLLPIDQEGEKVYEALLVPEPGGCSHSAQPPPNQLIHVFIDPPYRLSHRYEPVKVSGSLRPGIEKLQVLIVDGVTTVETGYRLSQSTISSTSLRPKTALPKSADTPWSFLKK